MNLKNASLRNLRKGVTRVRGAQLTFEIGHEGLSAAVQGVDYHLPVRGACDFDPPILETGSRRSTEPGRVCADVGRLGRKVERDTSIETLLDRLARKEEGLAGSVKGSVEGCDELEGAVGEDFGLGLGGLLGVDLDTGDHGDERVWGTQRTTRRSGKR